MRRVLAVVAGTVLGNAIYFALAFGVLAPVQQALGDSPEEWLGVAFYLLMPLGLFAGGLLAGYLSRTIPSPRWGLAALHAPGLYTFLATLFFGFDTAPIALFEMLGAAAVWVASSSFGVLVGAKWHGERAPAA